MSLIQTEQGIIQDDYLSIWVESFLKDRRSQGLSPGTQHFYIVKLGTFLFFCNGRWITQVGQLTPDSIRDYLIFLEDYGHNFGGIKACYRALKTFLKWYWDEVEPMGRNPITKVKLKKQDEEPLEPVSESVVRSMLSTCKQDIFSLRDRAMILVLLETGSRAGELLAMNRTNYIPTEGRIRIVHGKGGKGRSVFVEQRTRRALLRYVKAREDSDPCLWVTKDHNRLTYWGLRDMMIRRSKVANIDPPTLHSFRRGFAINSLRAGMDIYTLQKLMGHADLQVLRRYLKLVDEDLRASHRAASIVEKWEL